MRNFPVLGEKKTIFVDANRLNEEWALKIHGQTLSQLSSRGGLSPKEIFLNLNKLDSRKIKSISDYQASEAVESIRLKQ
ncbi:hypothetical protein MAELSTROM_32 [Pseudoalteromonas phage Maelstrom]|uniref:hypothetical protein n=1 Tax=Pseudoalteromonas phage Maelstrom TaxID=2065202 RepID=UPI000CA204CA|nr:hypothetical protein PP584_gp32 [Pseudoalteromonas phage Maelstrom]AUG84952.1 hypothetical protein MAELSTROM_32 [Pseudoalteromonas phage Maelstrom]